MSTHITSHCFFCFIQLDSLSTRPSDNCENTFLESLSKLRRDELILLCSPWYHKSSSICHCSYYFCIGTCCFPFYIFFSMVILIYCERWNLILKNSCGMKQHWLHRGITDMLALGPPRNMDVFVIWTCFMET